ncbi:BglG family transcription antiterminator LicT [Gilliamella apicola]|uniref:Transcription antiterminator BglG n=1 Tax=Gilliamella apicola TaxID=1196095 RepID=A0A2V4E3F9_9GAMM|nr:PRD domain-containing protein [Gilliamella apicola]PXZ02555.1 transcription antiterminator BglG [Gilliamella apicola]
MILVVKVLNSSVVLVEEEGIEKIVLGKGIGFGKKPGDTIDDERVDKIFLENNVKLAYITDLVKEVPFQFFQITKEIITLAENDLNRKLNNNIYLTLTDHIYFAVERVKQGLFIPNKLHWEIKNYYPQEFNIAKQAIELLNTRYDLAFPEEEASNIAFHLINAQTTSTQNLNAFQYAKMINSIVNLVKYSVGVPIDTSSIHYSRFITHIKFFVERFYAHNQLQEDNNDLYQQISSHYPYAMHIAEKVKQYIDQTYHYSISDDEVVYLGIHINRLIRNTK